MQIAQALELNGTRSSPLGGALMAHKESQVMILCSRPQYPGASVFYRLGGDVGEFGGVVVEVHVRSCRLLESRCYLVVGQSFEGTEGLRPRCLEPSRRWKRHGCGLFARSNDLVGFGGKVKDLSMGGLQLLTRKGQLVRSAASIVIDFESGDVRPHLYQARCVWSRGNEHGQFLSGWQFEHMDSVGEAYLRLFLRQRHPRSEG